MEGVEGGFPSHPFYPPPLPTPPSPAGANRPQMGRTESVMSICSQGPSTPIAFCRAEHGRFIRGRWARGIPSFIFRVNILPPGLSPPLYPSTPPPPPPSSCRPDPSKLLFQGDQIVPGDPPRQCFRFLFCWEFFLFLPPIFGSSGPPSPPPPLPGCPQPWMDVSGNPPPSRA